MRHDVNGIGIEVAVDGPDDGPAVLLLHGWPDSHLLWRHQVGPLVAAGYRCIAPDLRGFGESDRPDDVDAYSLLHVVGDVAGVLDGLEVPRAHVIGHDWGAAVAWLMGSLTPDRVGHLVTLSVGHPRSFGGAGLAQREKSWYMLLFQFQGVAERWLSDDDYANFRGWAQHPDVEAVIASLRRPGALTAGLNWYRANVPPSVLVDAPLELPSIQAPTMGVWSTGDMALTEVQMTGSTDYLSGPWRYERVEDAGHWMQLDQPDVITNLLLDFLPSPT